jgi:hypothetical protein
MEVLIYFMRYKFSTIATNGAAYTIFYMVSLEVRQVKLCFHGSAWVSKYLRKFISSLCVALSEYIFLLPREYSIICISQSKSRVLRGKEESPHAFTVFNHSLTNGLYNVLRTTLTFANYKHSELCLHAEQEQSGSKTNIMY